MKYHPFFPLRAHALTKIRRRVVGLFVILIAVVTGLFAQAPGKSTLSGHTPKEVRDGTATLVGHQDPNQMLRLAIGLQPPHMEEEQQFLHDVQTKGSPQFHHFLTADQWNKRFAPSEQDEQAVVDWLQREGLTVTDRCPCRLVVDCHSHGNRSRPSGLRR
jgi:hypothetical protein